MKLHKNITLRLLKYVLHAGLITLLLVGFQNCAGNGFQLEEPDDRLSSLTGEDDDSIIDLGPIIPTPTPTATPTPTPTATPSPTPISPTPTPAPTTVWIFHHDGSQPGEINKYVNPNAGAQKLTTAGIASTMKTKALRPSAHTVTQTGVFDAFQIKAADQAKALALGFMRDDSGFFSAVSCANKDAVVAFGQSNSANSGTTADRTAINGIYMHFNGHCYPVLDPILGATIFSGGGSTWMTFLRRYRQLFPARELVIFGFGYGGTTADVWLPGKVLNPRFATALKQITDSKMKVIKILWHQGESDTLSSTSEANYLATMKSIVAAFRGSGIAAPFHVSIASFLRYRPYLTSFAVQTAQLRLVEEDATVFLGVNTDQMPLTIRAADGLHFSAAGARTVGTEWARLVFETPVAQKTEEMVKAYYAVYFQRSPTPAELSDGITKATSQGLAVFRKNLQASNEAFIRALFINVALRIPDKDSYDVWVKKLTTQTRVKVEADFRAAVLAAKTADTNFEIISGSYQPRLTKWKLNREIGFLEPL